MAAIRSLVTRRPAVRTGSPWHLDTSSPRRGPRDPVIGRDVHAETRRAFLEKLRRDGKYVDDLRIE